MQVLMVLDLVVNMMEDMVDLMVTLLVDLLMVRLKNAIDFGLFNLVEAR